MLETKERKDHKLKKILVICMECGKTFTTTKIVPECPQCHGSDIELR